MDPNKEIEESFKELESLNMELVEVSNGKNGLTRNLGYLFLQGLPNRFDSTRIALLCSGEQVFNRKAVISSLEINERMRNGGGTKNLKIGESANQVRGKPPRREKDKSDIECWQCGKIGHFQAECWSKKDSKSKDSKSKSSKKKNTYQKGQRNSPR